MPTITQLSDSKRGPNRKRVYLDGAFAFSLNLNVIAKFRLREGLALTEEQVERIRHGEVRQECFDYALRVLQTRLHSRAELAKKLAKKEFPPEMTDEVLGELARMGYVDDDRFAKTRAMSAAQYKHHGRRRAYQELLRTGVKRDVAERALNDVYSEDGVGADQLSTARDLARKKLPSLKRLDPVAAKRRLVGMLQRRGFDYETIKPVIDEVLGRGADD